MQGFKVGLGGDLQLIIASGIFDHQRAGRGHDVLHLVVRSMGVFTFALYSCSAQAACTSSTSQLGQSARM